MFFIKFIGRIISVLIFLAVTICVLGSLVSPAWLPYSSIVSILFPYVYLSLLVWTLVSCFLGWRALLPCILGIVIGYQQFSCIYIPFWQKNEEHTYTNATPFRVLSWNVGNFSTSLQHVTEQKIFEQLEKTIIKSKADIICLQEIYIKRTSNKIKALAKRLKFSHISYGQFTGFAQADYQGSVIISKFPIVQQDKLSRGTSLRNNLVIAAIQTPQGTVRLLSVHLQSNQLSAELLEELQQLPQTQDKEVVYSASSKINSNSRIRLEQIKEINALCNLSKEPVIICADLNDIAGSYNYCLMRKERHDAFLEQGTGYRNTYVNEDSRLGIDFIFTEASLNVCGYEQYEAAFSDHFPHVAEICIQRVQ